VKGLAFSDSFRTIESRLNALLHYKPEKHRFALFSGIVFAVLIASFGWSYAVLGDWYVASHPDEPLPYTFFVVFEDEVYSEAMMELLNDTDVGVFPDSYPNRPDNDFFEGTYKFLDSNTMEIDRYALYERLKTLDRNGAKVSTLAIYQLGYNMTTDRPTSSGVEYPMSAFELNDEYPQYEIADFENNMLEGFYLFMAHWL
jgi:hypothetical protein